MGTPLALAPPRRSSAAARCTASNPRRPPWRTASSAAETSFRFTTARSCHCPMIASLTFVNSSSSPPLSQDRVRNRLTAKHNASQACGLATGPSDSTGLAKVEKAPLRLGDRHQLCYLPTTIGDDEVLPLVCPLQILPEAPPELVHRDHFHGSSSGGRRVTGIPSIAAHGNNAHTREPTRGASGGHVDGWPPGAALGFLYSSRSARATGRRAARSAGKRPPTRPMSTA